MKKSKEQRKRDQAFIDKIKSLNLGIKSVEICKCDDCGGEYLHVQGTMSIPLKPPPGWPGNPANN